MALYLRVSRTQGGRKIGMMLLSHWKDFVYIAEVKLDLKGYLKCAENVKVPDRRAGPLSERGSSQGEDERSLRE